MVWSGSRTRDRQIRNLLLYPTELSSGGRTGFEPAPTAFAAARPLSFRPLAKHLLPRLGIRHGSAARTGRARSAKAGTRTAETCSIDAPYCRLSPTGNASRRNAPYLFANPFAPLASKHHNAAHCARCRCASASAGAQAHRRRESLRLWRNRVVALRPPCGPGLPPRRPASSLSRVSAYAPSLLLVLHAGSSRRDFTRIATRLSGRKLDSVDWTG